MDNPFKNAIQRRGSFGYRPRMGIGESRQISKPTVDPRSQRRMPGYTPPRNLEKQPFGSNTSTDRLFGNRVNQAMPGSLLSGNMKHATPAAQNAQPQKPAFQWDNNPMYDAAMRRIQQAKSGIESERDSAFGRINEDRSRATESLAKWRDEMLKNNMQKFADQGLVHSGINIGEQAEIGEEYTDQTSALGQQFARIREDIERATTQRMQELANVQDAAERQRQYDQIQADRERAMQEALASLQEDRMRIQPVEPAPSFQQPAPQTDYVDRGTTGGNRPAAPSVNPGGDITGIANQLGYSVGNTMNDADYLKIKDALGIKVGSVLDPADKTKIDAALRSRSGAKASAPKKAASKKKAAPTKNAIQRRQNRRKSGRSTANRKNFSALGKRMTRRR